MIKTSKFNCFVLRGLLAGIIASLIASDAGNSYAASIEAVNFSSDFTTFVPVIACNGNRMPAGSAAVAIGTFLTLTPTQISALVAAGKSQTALADFTVFGSPDVVGGAGAFGLAGLYDVYSSVPIAPASPLVGHNIYTIVGDAPTLALSNLVIVYRHNATFAADLPLASATVMLGDSGLGSSALVVGGSGTRTFSIFSSPGTYTSIGCPPPQPVISTLRQTGTGGADLSVTFATVNQAAYKILASTDLQTWSQVGSAVSGNGTPLTVLLAGYGSGARRFLRMTANW